MIAVLSKGTRSTFCLSKKGLPADVYPPVKAEVVAVSNLCKLTKIRLCCLTTSLDPAGPITLAYNGCNYALATAIEYTAGYKSGEPVLICIHCGYGADKKLKCQQALRRKQSSNHVALSLWYKKYARPWIQLAVSSPYTSQILRILVIKKS